MHSSGTKTGFGYADKLVALGCEGCGFKASTASPLPKMATVRLLKMLRTVVSTIRAVTKKTRMNFSTW